MKNKLFDSIVRTCGADTDDIHSGEAEGNFWAENQLFEWVLRECFLNEAENSISEIGGIGGTSVSLDLNTTNQKPNGRRRKEKNIPESPFADLMDKNKEEQENHAPISDTTIQDDMDLLASPPIQLPLLNDDEQNIKTATVGDLKRASDAYEKSGNSI